MDRKLALGMSVVKVPDGAGHTLTVLDVNGHIFPTFPVDVINNIPRLPIRDDDILISGYPKSGTHLLWELSRVLLKGSCGDDRTEKDSLMIEQMSHEHLEKMASPRILNTHIPFSMVPKEVFWKGLKILYLQRNPKDSAVSFYNHHVKLKEYYDYGGTFKDYLPLWANGKVDYGSWFDHIRSWHMGLAKYADVPKLTVVYEEFMDNPLSQIKKISHFFGKSYSDEFLREVQDWCSFESMRKRKGKHDLTEDGQPIMYRKGKVGDWKDWFTVAQNEWFDQVCKEKMADLDIEFKYTL